MQTQINQILTAANNSGVFNLVTGRIKDEYTKYPAFIVGRRDRDKFNPSGDHSSFDIVVKAQCIIMLDAASKTFTDLENTFKAFHAEVIADSDMSLDEDFTEREFEARSSHYNVLVRRFQLIVQQYGVNLT